MVYPKSKTDIAGRSNCYLVTGQDVEHYRARVGAFLRE